MSFQPKSSTQTNKRDEQKIENKLSYRDRTDKLATYRSTPVRPRIKSGLSKLQKLEHGQKPLDVEDHCLPSAKHSERVITVDNPQSTDNIYQFSFDNQEFQQIQIQNTFIIFHNECQVTLPTYNEHDEEDFSSSELYSKLEESYGDESFNFQNKFNFAEWSTQTIQFIEDQGVGTNPSSKQRFIGSVTQYEIYKAYTQEISLEHHEDKAIDANIGLHSSLSNISIWPLKFDPDNQINAPKKLINSLMILERLVNQNNEIHFFKKLFSTNSEEDAQVDSYHTLWKANSPAHFSNSLQVTALEWNPFYKDLFVVGLGKYNLSSNSQAAIYCYSLKNMRRPEYYFAVSSPVCCISWNPTSVAIFAAGFLDGSVSVFDLRSDQVTPLCTSSTKLENHDDAVWDLKWAADESPNNYILYSISGDGCMSTWILTKCKLVLDEVIDYNKNDYNSTNTDAPGRHAYLCFDFHPEQKDIYIIGTEEGPIYKCSKIYGNHFLKAYKGHQLPVHSLCWNPVEPRTFLSASSDWTIRIWDDLTSSVLMVFDCSQPIIRACWAPKSSCLFAATLNDGSLYFYDLSQNFYDKANCHKIVKKGKLTNLAISKQLPIIIVGDENGNVHCLKVPPKFNNSLDESKNYNGSGNLEGNFKITRFIDKVLPLIFKS